MDYNEYLECEHSNSGNVKFTDDCKMRPIKYPIKCLQYSEQIQSHQDIALQYIRHQSNYFFDQQ